MGFLRKVKRTHKVCLFLVGFIILVSLYVTPDPSYSAAPRSRGTQVVDSIPNVHFKKKDVKKILMWTGMFKKTDTSKGIECLSTCEAKCEIETDKAKIQDVDGVFFHLSDIWTKEWRINTRSVIDFPKYRSPDQVWVLMNMEPPPHLYGNIEILNGLFNWTAWYRGDADLPWLYGAPYRLTEQEQAEAKELYKDRNFYKEKTNEITALISNCFDPGQRYRPIAEIAKRYPVKAYGKCYSGICGDPKDPGSCEAVLKDFKFYLAFENDVCRDYITEKYWNALTRDQIPIVNWVSYDKTKVIPHSYINIHDFPSIDSLVTYLKKVSSNETLYNSYLKYKTQYRKQRSSCSTCMMCKALHDPDRPARTYADLDSWVRDDICEKVGIWNNLMKNFYGWRFYLFGI